MYRRDRLVTEDRYKHDLRNPSFSSSLLDEIYRSIEDGDTKHQDLKFYGEMASTKNRIRSLEREDLEMSGIHRACLVDKWMDKKVSQMVTTHQRRQRIADLERRSQLDHDHDQDVIFFSSSSSSSDSSSGGFSSSDTESIYGGRSKASSYSLPPLRPKPVKTSVSKTHKTERAERTLFYEQRELHIFDDYQYSSASEQTPRVEEGLIKSKSRALRIYSNLKKVKQPISPGGKLANFINSLFTASTPRKSKKIPSVSNFDEERKEKSGQASTCSSASSFSRSCLSKHSPSTREKLRNGVKRTVRFCPVSVIVDEDCRPCGHKSLYQEETTEEESSLMSLSLPTAWKIGKSPSRKVDDALKLEVTEKSRRVEEVARKFLKDYHQDLNKNDVTMRDVNRNHYIDEDEDEDDDDDVSSCSSSDLFELDHLAVIGKNNRYCEELPVYETTHVGTNRAIANGLLM